MLALLLKHLLRETWSGDALYLAFSSARNEARLLGMDDDAFAEVMGRVLKHWERNSSPLREAMGVPYPPASE